MWIGDVPNELKDLTLPEQHLISLYRHNQCVMKFESVYHSIDTQQSKLKGNCISVNELLQNFKHHKLKYKFIVPTKYVQYCNNITIAYKRITRINKNNFHWKIYSESN